MTIRRMLKHINLFLALSLAAFLPAGCSKEGSPDTPSPDDKGVMAVAIGIGGQTRVASSPEYEIGSELENTINLDKGYRILFFSSGTNADGGGRYIATFDATANPLTVTPDQEYFYTFLGNIPGDLPAKFKILMLANWRTYPSEGTVPAGELQLIKGVTTIKDVTTHASSTFGYFPTGISEQALIPLYGVREFDLTMLCPENVKDGKVKPDAKVDLNKTDCSIPLLRAAAKVEVILNDASMNFSSVEIDKVNRQGYCAPFSSADTWAFDHTDYDHGKDWNLDYVKTLHLLGNANDPTPADPVPFKNIAEAGAPGHWVAYVPEYMNVGTDNFCSITVNIEGKGSKKIYFATNGLESSNNNKDVAAQGTTAGRYNIERNNIYRFTVTNISNDPDEMAVSLDVQPYASLNLSYDLGLSRDERGDLKVEKGSAYYDNLMALFTEHPEYKPCTGNYISNGNGVYSFVPANWDGSDFTQETDPTKYTPLECDYDNGDYYAVVFTGTNPTPEFWVKDRDGCRVLSNYLGTTINIKNDASCSSRYVWDLSASSRNGFYKDYDGFHRLQHNGDHSTVVLDSDMHMLFKTVTEIKEGENTRYVTDQLFKVESWNDPGDNPAENPDPTAGDFWYITHVSPSFTFPDYPTGVDPVADAPQNLNGETVVVITYLFGNWATGVIPENDSKYQKRREVVKYSDIEGDKLLFPVDKENI